MNQWIWAIVTATLAAVAALTAALLSRRRTRQLVASLNAMLDRATAGEFTEQTFDESVLSALEARMARFLCAYGVSSRSLAAEKESMKSLISDISHQTKTPVANILLYTQLLAEQELTEEGRQCAEALSTQAEKLDFLIGALVKASRLESGIIAVVPQRNAIQPLLDTVVDQIGPKALAKEISIRLEPTEGTACYDPKWTAEALYNILDNAVKYAPSKSTVAIQAVGYEMFYRIDITDQGPGIPEEEQSKVFARFYRSPSVQGEEGVGIGLFLTREILAKGGGYLKVASKPGQGATFSVFLPTEIFQNC